MINVLFVCLGNICRSPMAEAIFRAEVQKNGLSSEIHVESAGTAAWHSGKPPHEGTRDILDKYNISYENMYARQVEETDFTRFDYIIAMDNQNVKDIKNNYNISDHVVLKKLTDLIDDTTKENVPDPYYTGNFNETYELVHHGVEGLLKLIKQNKEKSE